MAAHKGIESKAAISGHPLHPMLIPFPIAYLVGALFTDLTYIFSNDPFWARASLWLVGAGLVTGILAAGFGLTDFISRRQIRSHWVAWAHFIGNASVLVLAFISVSARAIDAPDAVAPWGLLLSFVIAAMLVFTGWLGGELAYRHKVGVIEPSGRRAPPGEAGSFYGKERRTGPPDRRVHA